MPTLQPFYFNLDNTGLALSNKVVSEEHITQSGSFKLILPKFGPYFTSTLNVYEIDNLNNRTLLIRNTHYQCIELLEKQTIKYGKEICGVVLLTNTSTNKFQIDYQALGGTDTVNAPLLLQTITNLNIDNVSIPWTEVKNKPNIFPPGPHLHDSADLYGVEYITDELKRIGNSINIANTAAHEYMIELIKQLILDTKAKADYLYHGTSINEMTILLDNLANEINALKDRLKKIQLKFSNAESFYYEAERLLRLRFITYKLTSRTTIVNECQLIHFTITTTNVPDGTILYYQPVGQIQ